MSCLGRNLLTGGQTVRPCAPAQQRTLGDSPPSTPAVFMVKQTEPDDRHLRQRNERLLAHLLSNVNLAWVGFVPAGAAAAARPAGRTDGSRTRTCWTLWRRMRPPLRLGRAASVPLLRRDAALQIDSGGSAGGRFAGKSDPTSRRRNALRIDLWRGFASPHPRVPFDGDRVKSGAGRLGDQKR